MIVSPSGFSIDFTSAHSFFLQIEHDNRFLVQINSFDISRNLENVTDSYRTPSLSVKIIRDTANSIVTHFSNGVSVTITEAAGLPNFLLNLPKSLQGATQGLLGNSDGEITNDFVYPDGRVIADDSTDRQIHIWGESCKYISTNCKN